MSWTTEFKQNYLWILVAILGIVILSFLGPVLMPFIVAAILAYMLTPAVDKLSSWKIRKKNVPRTLSGVIVILSLLFSITLLFLIVIPVLSKELPLLQDQIPKVIAQLNAYLAPKLLEFGINFNLDSGGVRKFMTEHLSDSSEAIGKAIFSSLKVGGAAILGMIANLLLIPIVLFYLLLDWHSWVARFSRMIPRRMIQMTSTFATEVDNILAQYLRGQMMVMLSLSAYYVVALWLVRFDLALPVGLLTGVLVFIPYLGYGLGLVLAISGAILQFAEWHGVAAVAAVYAIGQVLEGFVLTPRFVGERIGLHPLTVIFALMAFGQLFGFVGVLIALPASAVLAVAVKHIRNAYLQSHFYLQS